MKKAKVKSSKKTKTNKIETIIGYIQKRVQTFKEIENLDSHIKAKQIELKSKRKILRSYDLLILDEEEAK